MARLSSNPNIYNTCLRILRDQGFDLSIHREDESTEIHECLWVAEKGEFDFLAESPIALLGLATIHELIKPQSTESYWWRIEGQDIYDELFDKAYPETLEDD